VKTHLKNLRNHVLGNAVGSQLVYVTELLESEAGSKKHLKWTLNTEQQKLEKELQRIRNEHSLILQSVKDSKNEKLKKQIIDDANDKFQNFFEEARGELNNKVLPVLEMYVSKHDRANLDLSELNLNYVWFPKVKNLQDPRPVSEIKFNQLTDTYENRSYLGNINFRGSKLRYADLSNSAFSGTNFTDADCYGASLRNADMGRKKPAILNNTSFVGANLSGSIIHDFDLTTVKLVDYKGDERKAANLKGAKITYKKIDGLSSKMKNLVNLTNFTIVSNLSIAEVNKGYRALDPLNMPNEDRHALDKAARNIAKQKADAAKQVAAPVVIANKNPNIFDLNLNSGSCPNSESSEHAPKKSTHTDKKIKVSESRSNLDSDLGSGSHQEKISKESKKVKAVG
jgi:hypothetical protein